MHLQSPARPADATDQERNCPDCGHDDSGVTYTDRPGFLGRQKVEVTRCYRDIADYGFGDVDSCTCTNVCHQNRGRRVP